MKLLSCIVKHINIGTKMSFPIFTETKIKRNFEKIAEFLFLNFLEICFLLFRNFYYKDDLRIVHQLLLTSDTNFC
jgi:hypothetical protein